MLIMEGTEYWRLCDELTIVQAALLVCGENPSILAPHIESHDIQDRPDGYEAAKAAISNALRRESIEGTLIPIYEYDINGNTCGVVDDSIDLQVSRVSVDSLQKWLSSRGLKSGFFFPDRVNTPDYLDPTHARYAPKLAAAVNAWLAVADNNAPSNRSPKQRLMKWLREHAADYGLSDEDGKPNETGIEEVAKVANWRPTGGAPKTLGD
jgi:hypothetical protein